MNKMLGLLLVLGVLITGCAHVSSFQMIDQKLNNHALNRSLLNSNVITPEVLKSKKVALSVTGYESNDLIKSKMEEYLVTKGVVLYPPDKAECILNVRVEVFGNLQDDTFLPVFYYTSRRIGECLLSLSLYDIKSNQIILTDKVRSRSGWTETYVLWMFGPIRSYWFDLDETQYSETNGEVLNGLVKKFYKNDVLRSAINYVDNKKEGSAITYYENGNLQEEANYANNCLDGDYKSFYPDGSKKTDEYYNKGGQDGLYLKYYQNGQVAIKMHYKDYELDGSCEEYDDKGTLLKRDIFKNGKKVKEAKNK